MNDRPTAGELVEAVRRFLEAELLPTVGDARLRFQALVAVNVLGIVGRELAAEEEMLREEWRLLGPGGAEPGTLAELRRAVREASGRLCERIRAGEFDDPARFRALAGLARQTVRRKLEVANPRYLGAR
jgi:hypothetical protein